QTYRGSSESIILSCELSDAIKSLSSREGCTPFMTMLAAFKVLLYRYTGVADILVGTPIANRTRVEIESLIGFFVNTLVLRSDLSGDPSFCEFMHRVRYTALEAYAHQDLPFEKLVEDIRPERSLSHSPLFQVMFVFQNTQPASLDFSNLTLTPVKADTQTSKFDLTLFIIETDQGFRVLMEYNTDLFNRDSIVRMLGHFQTLLESIVNNPDVSVSALPILTEVEQDQLLLEWNDTKVDYPQDRCIHQLFEAQVGRTPEAVAVQYEDLQLTYRELNGRSNQLAHYLIKYGVGPDVLVGIFVERSHMMLVGVLAILKAGGAYVPLDPTLPEKRLAFFLKDTQVRVLLTEKSLVKAVPEIKDQPLVCLDIELTDSYMESGETLECRAGPGDSAYVIYTSGSTGKPKGVSVPHRAAVNFLTRMLTEPGLTDHDALLAVTTLSFDITLLELFLPLIVGARTIIASHEAASDGNSLLKILKKHDITLMQATPSTWRLLLSAGWNGDSHFKVLCGGEAMPGDLMKELVHRVGSVWNMYGPTETTVWSTCVCINNVDDPVSIGRPIGNTKTYVLDKQMQLVPIGVRGELYIGGDGVSSGYINRADLTADCFVNDPFTDDINARIYKTGDVVRYRCDGNMEYLDRLDNQVKIRGFRIELGEIETVIAKHDKVEKCVVNIWKKSLNDIRLVAYLVLLPGYDVAVGDLRMFLKEELPEYMLPQHIVKVDRFPLSPSGKVDRMALSHPVAVYSDLKADFVAPQSKTEKQLAEIWHNVIGVDKVGINDNFFELGGHSLLATQLVSRIRDALQIDIPLRKVFEAPTVCRLAECVTTALQSTSQLQTPPLKQIHRQGKMPLSFAQQRLWFLDQMEEGSSFYNISSSFCFTGDLDVSALHQSLNTIVSRHETLRTSFITEEGIPFQTINQSDETDLQIVDLSDVDESKRESELRCLISEETQRPFNLSEGPLIRSTLLRLDEHDQVLHLVMHHIISDGWSLGIFMRELSVLYNDFSEGILPTHAALPIQYADFAHWQRQWLKGEPLQKQLSYWRNRLERAPSLLDLPTDRPRPSVQSYSGSSESIMLSCELSESIKSLSSREGGTPFMTMLAAFNILLYRYTGVDDVLVGTPIANRTRVEIERLIGFFVNTLVLRSDLSGDPSFREFFQRVRESALEAYAHQDLPFEKLVEEIQPERSLSHSPLFQVMFVFQNTQPLSSDFSNLTLSPVKVDTQTSKFDLTLFIIEKAQGFRLLMEFNTDLFNRDSIVRMLGHFQTLLESIVKNPEFSVSALPILNEAEKKQLLFEWNDTKAHYTQDETIVDLFQAQVERTPDDIAVVFENQQLSYRLLNRKANQLAHYLLSFKRETDSRSLITNDCLVGICVGRSIDMVIGLLGILKAGGAYVPLDPDYPVSRLRFILEDSMLPVLLSQSHLVERFSATQNSGTKVICMDKVSEQIAVCSTDNLARQGEPENVAYVIYTSGSTGKPKGTLLSHESLINYLNWALIEYNLPPGGTGVPVQSSISFDATITSLYLPLISGNRVILLPEKQEIDCLADLLRDPGMLGLIKITPAHLEALNQQLEELEYAHSTCALIIGGEALTTSQIQPWLIHAPQVRLINEYGPTESVVGCSMYDAGGRADLSGSVPIGCPIANTRIYVLDAKYNPVPLGISGELCIAGAGVAKGYLNRPELTSEKFIEIEISGKSERIYKTGDIARWLPDGNLEFLGRIDHQVKIRGFRIELGEIETVIGEHDKVCQCVVNVWKKSLSDIRLVAYVVTLPGDDLTIGELMNFLSDRLPEYMLPQHVVRVDRFPLSPAGKVNRNALPHPDHVDSDLKPDFVEPETRMEKLLAEIWQDVLGVDKVGINENFFELGGHSLLVVRLIYEIKMATGKKLGVIGFFHNPTIVQLAESLMLEGTPDESSLIMIKPGGSKVPLFWVHDTFLVDYLDQDYPLYVLIHPTQDGRLPIHSTIEDIAGYYVQEILKVRPEGPYALGGYCFWAVIALEMAQVLKKMGHEVSLLFLVNPSKKCLPAWSLGVVGRGSCGDSKSRVMYHLNNIKQLKNTEKVPYLMKKLKSLLRRYYRRLSIRIKIAICRSYLFFGRPVPQPYIRFYVYAIYAGKLLRKYASQVYGGRVVVVQSEHDYERDQSDWNKLSTHEVERHVVPESDHLNILRDTHRSVWIRWLNMYLRRIVAVSKGKGE
ncbi:MAG: amino acid adenylation domain-containing protein, partial [Planctomycetes bacterium]|nr:amino acid adenylation domain-containing protein [Planctomycetota bacterium]